MKDTIAVLNDILGFSEKPVSFETFCKSPDFCNTSCVYDFWITSLSKVPENCVELLLDGSLGGGKSYAGAYYFAYRVYLLFCHGDPRPEFDLDPGSPLYCLYFSVSLSMAKKSGFTYLYDVFKNCKWFKDHHPMDTDIKSSIVFRDINFEIDYASTFGHQIGLNVWGFLFDEGNFRDGVGTGVSEQYVEAANLYEQLLQRQESRFSTPKGVNAVALLISSASYQTSFTESRKKEIKKNPKAHFITSTTYDVKPWQFSKKKFEVFIGAGVINPCIIESKEQKDRLMKEAGLLNTGQESEYIKKVPVSLKPSFIANIVSALQNHCGVPMMIQGRFMMNMKPLYASYDDKIPKIFVSDELIASTADDTALIEYLIPDRIEHPERPHSIFIDMSVVGDPGSITCYRYDGKDEHGLGMHTKVFTVAIIPPPYPAQTRITKVKDFIIDLSQVMNIVAVGSDQYQSTSLRQEIQIDLGLEDIRVSIDSTDVPHLCWQRALVDKRIRMRKNAVEEKEIEEAQYDLKRHRVFKVKGTHDDRFQSDVGAFFLSETIGQSDVDVSGLYNGNINIVGNASAKKMMDRLGYVGATDVDTSDYADKSGFDLLSVK